MVLAAVVCLGVMATGALGRSRVTPGQGRGHLITVRVGKVFTRCIAF